MTKLPGFRQDKIKPAAPVRTGTLGLQAAAVGFDNMMRYCQTDTAASAGAGAGFIHTVKSFKNLSYIVLSKADSTVFNTTDHLIAYGFCMNPDHTAGGSVLQSIPEKVDKHLLQAFPIGLY